MLFFKQNKKSIDNITIILHDKSLPVIQQYIQGKWKLQYQTGGFCSTCTVYPTDTTFNLFMTLTDERIDLKNNYYHTVDTTITWSYIQVFRDSAYALNFTYSSGIPFTLVPDRIHNDKLVIYQPGPDGLTFYYSESN